MRGDQEITVTIEVYTFNKENKNPIENSHS